MSTRLIIAYTLIAVMVLAAAAIAWWSAYHSRERTEARRLVRRAKREQLRDAAKMEGSTDHG